MVLCLKRLGRRGKMDDWKTYSATKNESQQGSSENKAKILEYILIKLTDNFLVVAIFSLCLLGGWVGLFKIDNSTNPDKVNWALHAAELCLGVFLGLLKKKK